MTTYLTIIQENTERGRDAKTDISIVAGEGIFDMLTMVIVACEDVVVDNEAILIPIFTVNNN